MLTGIYSRKSRGKYKKNTRFCSVDGCLNKHMGRSFCKRHYLQIFRHGRLLDRTTYDKNEIIDYEDYYEICLYSGNGEQKEIARTKIDREDVEKVKCYKWHLSHYGYAKTNRQGEKPKSVHLHGLILDVPFGCGIDHINHDRLDNRKKNLRIATKSQNAMNQKTRPNSKSGKTGVLWYRNRWVSSITVRGKVIYLGRFKNREVAIDNRRKAENKYFGEFAYKDN